MHIFFSSKVPAIPPPTDLLRLLTISSYHEPLYSIHTMMRPFWSLDVNFWNGSFQHMFSTVPEWPSSVWFIDRFREAANPLAPVLLSPPPVSAAALPVVTGP